VEQVVAAYIPVLHEGYRRFLERHGRGRPLHLIGPELYADYRPLAKDIRALDAEAVRAAVAAWGICSRVEVLTAASAEALARERPHLTLPAEDVSYRVVDRFFERCSYSFDTVFLRWDRIRTAALVAPAPARTVGPAEAFADLQGIAEDEASRSLDWWRRVGAAMRLASGEILHARNEHLPHPLSPYAVGDPRASFYQGVHLELSTAAHAEATLVAAAARRGLSTAGAVVYVTDFPCPPCAKLLAAAGIAQLYFRDGYAVLDGEDVLAAAGVEVIGVAAGLAPT
jgi:dCMP deaminase